MPSAHSLYKGFQFTLQRFPENLAVVSGPHRLTYSALSERVDRLSDSLRKAGVIQGERVAVLLPNGPEFVIASIAIWKAGAIVAPFHVKFHEEEISRYLADCETRTIISGSRLSSLVDGLRKRRPELRSGVLLSQDPAEWQLLSWTDASPSVTHGPNPSGDSPALTQYSTGSTGRSKRVSRSHQQLLEEFETVSSILGITSTDRILGAVPMYHSYGFMNAMICSFLSGATLYAVGDSLPRDLARLIEREKITGFPGVPFIWQMLADLEGQWDFSSIRYALAAGAPLTEQTAHAVHAKYGVTLHQLYGTTETGVISVNLGEDSASHFTSVGRTIPGVTVGIVDEQGNALPPGTSGAIAVRSAYATRSYDGEVGNSESRFDAGVFYPGDQGSLDTEGRLTLSGRKRRFINVAGNKVDPSELEDLLRDHPSVADVAVVGISDGLGAEKVKAAIVLASPSTEGELFEFCRSRVADFKCPRVIEFRSELPRNPMGKILRKYLLEDS